MCAALNSTEEMLLAALRTHNKDVADVMKSLNTWLQDTQSFILSPSIRNILRENLRNGNVGKTVYLYGWIDCAEVTLQLSLAIHQRSNASSSNQIAQEITMNAGATSSVSTTDIGEEQVIPSTDTMEGLVTIVQNAQGIDRAALFGDGLWTPTTEGEGASYKTMEEELLAMLTDQKKKVATIIESLSAWVQHFEYFTVGRQIREILKETLRDGEMEKALYLQGWLDYAEMAKQRAVSIHQTMMSSTVASSTI